MKWILIGHRGVGKSDLLNRIKTYLDDQKTNLPLFFDLDQEIAKTYKKPLIDLFPEVGEPRFRQIEHQLFEKIDSENINYIISVGAGFSFETYPGSLTAEHQIIWVRRKTDELGRIFFNRPRLNSNVSPLEEFKEKFSPRQKQYQQQADIVFIVPEGLTQPHLIEKEIFVQTSVVTKGILTVMPWHLKKINNLLKYDVDLYELRDDLIDLDTQPWKLIPKNKRLLSFRNLKNFTDHFKYLNEVSESDWALELGPCPNKNISIISCHNSEANESLQQFLHRLEKAALPQQHLKAAPIIRTYEELAQLIQWQEHEPQRRSILPRSDQNETGKWLWMRLYMKGRQKINFWRDSDGSALDQPTLFEWLSTPTSTSYFAALLGDPVIHSRTMIEQADFFKNFQAPVWPILLKEDEFKNALPFLIKLGLIAAAVTSPLKKVAHLTAQQKTSEALELQAVNTIAISQSVICGHNTDLFGMQQLLEQAAAQLQKKINELSIVIWGGGGTLAMLQKLLPQAISLSVRTGLTRNSTQNIPDQTDLLIWAASPTESFPPAIEFNLLIDLNYREDSHARELALQNQKPYLGGDLMFKAQAAGQRQYWKNLLVKDKN